MKWRFNWMVVWNLFGAIVWGWDLVEVCRGRPVIVWSQGIAFGFLALFFLFDALKAAWGVKERWEFES